jgi:hypothetical protein
MRLPKPIYEVLPFFLLAIGGLFIYLVLRQYEYAPTLFIWLLGMFCIFAGAGLIVMRWLYRRAARANAVDQYDDDGN